MFGQNIKRKVASYDESGKTLQVHSIFRTVQGEGPFAGHRAIFIRLTGCNLQCQFCDTKWDDEHDPYTSVDDIFEEVWQLSRDNSIDTGTVNLVVITGGEPALQNLKPLIRLLHRMDYDVQIETSGSVWSEAFEIKPLEVVISPKTAKINNKFYDRHKYTTYWKYVIDARYVDEDTGLPLWNTQLSEVVNGVKTYKKKKVLAAPTKWAIENYNVYVTPCDTYDEKLNRDNYEVAAQLAIKYGFIAGIQLHKHFNVE